MNKVLKISFSIVVITLISLIGTFGYLEKESIAELYHQVVVRGKSLSFVRPTAEVNFTSGGLTLQGSLYLPKGTGPFPGIVLTHGGTKLGRKLSLYKLLSDKLAQRGYGVLSFDFRGYGESEDPMTFETPADLDFVEDVMQAVSFLSSHPKVNGSHIYLVGHSFGAGVIIPAGIHNPRVKSIISISPGRRGYELFWSENAPVKHFPRSRLAEDMEIPQLRRIPIKFLNPILQYLTVDTVLNYPVHPPILLIDGEDEDPKDLRFLRELYEKMTEPKAYTTIQNADHYFGTLRDDTGQYQMVTYWDDIVTALVDTIDQWIRM